MTDIPIPISLPEGFSKDPDYVCLKVGISTPKEMLAFEYFAASTAASESDAHAFMFADGEAKKPELGSDPLDIVLKKDSWIFIGFHQLMNMYFSNRIPAFNLKKIPELEYGGIYHYSSPTHGSPHPIDDCIVARFAVKVKPEGEPQIQYHDLVNYNIDLIQAVVIDGQVTKGRLPIILDPGVKYPGPLNP